MLTPEQLAEIVREAVRAELTNGFSRLRSKAEWVPCKKAPIPRTTLDRLRDEGVVRSRKVGRDVYFHAGDLEAWMAQAPAMKKAEPEPAAKVVDGADAFEAARARARARRSA